jgi:PTS system nitrogen regulatory IIA component
MKLADFVREDLILADLQATEKGAVIDEIAALIAARVPALDAAAVARILKDREELASTAVGDGVAIPHGKLAAAGDLVSCVARATQGLDFAAHDGKPTYLFVVLVAPENSTGVHLKALARISRLFKDADFRERLLAAPDAKAMYAVIIEEDAKV